MKIAIVGSGIAGNTIAHLLYRQHDITVFEKNSRIGGHSHTHQIELENKQINVDTGFIVFNKKTYPLFTNLMDKLGVAYENSNMSFSVFSEENNVEYKYHRYMIEKHTPSWLLDNNHMTSDKAFVKANLKTNHPMYSFITKTID